MVRNFWLELDVGHRRLETGPRGVTDGFDLLVRVRERGGISNKVVRLVGRSIGGELFIDVEWPDGGHRRLVRVDR
jgi:hypothetical protein